MLKRLTVKNLALISYLELEFGAKLNILSGETGAGKSIIVDSLMLLLGGKYDKTLLKYGENSGFVEGVFECANAAELLNSIGADEDELIIVNRKFFEDGRNDIRVNGKMMTALMLKSFMSHLVDIYGQNEFQSLLKVQEQRRILDCYLKSEKLEALSKTYFDYKAAVRDCDSLGDAEKRAREIDLLRFQIDEIKKAAVTSGEEEQLVERRRIIMSAERIAGALSAALAQLENDEGTDLPSLADVARKELVSVSGFDKNYETLADRLQSVEIELSDIADTLHNELDKVKFDEKELDKIEKRLEVVRSLKRKYGNCEAMEAFVKKSEAELVRLENGAADYDSLLQRKQSLETDLYNLCCEVSSDRKEGAKKMERAVETELSELGMDKAKFEIIFTALPSRDDFAKTVTQSGADKFEFYLSPNVGQPLKPLAKIISGGELSRFMLAIKIVSSAIDGIDTLIFDEIDTGISGAIGQAVAQKLAKLSRNSQVLCVTHLAQIAAMADSHYFISKHTVEGDTKTEVVKLDRNGEIDEISRLSGAKNISATSTATAQELKIWSDNYKSSLV